MGRSETKYLKMGNDVEDQELKIHPTIMQGITNRDIENRTQPGKSGKNSKLSTTV